MRRRARPLLGTWVEVGLLVDADGTDPADLAESGEAVFAAVFGVVQQVQSKLSRFDPSSDISRFNAMAGGERIRVALQTRSVLLAARELCDASDGLFDISLGSGMDDWVLDGDWLSKRSAYVRLDLGGIGKGHAVDLGLQAMIDLGCRAGWVNAGGDLRVFGDVMLPVRLRDDTGGGVRHFATLGDGAFATSAFGPDQRSALAGVVAGNARAVATGGDTEQAMQVSVAAPLCLWADALTKLVARCGHARHPLLDRYQSLAWCHG